MRTREMTFLTLLDISRGASILSYCVLALLVGLTGCDDAIFAAGEMEAKRKYEAIKIGTSRESVLRELGTPSFVLSWNAAQQRYDYRDENGKDGTFHPTSESSRMNDPPELGFLPKGMIFPVVLIYSAGTVFGYYGLDSLDRVSSVKVRIS